MGTEILRPQDCLIQRIRVPPANFSRRRTYSNCSNYYYNNHVATSRSSRKPSARPDHRKRVVVGSTQLVTTEVLKRSSVDDSRMARSSGSVIEKVTILRRGESLDSKLNLDSSSVTVKSDVYAGSAFAVSPSPSALPLPSFPTKKQASPAFDDSATRDLRRLLRLE